MSPVRLRRRQGVGLAAKPWDVASRTFSGLLENKASISRGINAFAVHDTFDFAPSLSKLCGTDTVTLRSQIIWTGTR
jgi:hypothetical protein